MGEGENGGGGKKKVAIMGVSSLLLVAMVVGTVVGVTRHQNQKSGEGNGGGAPATSGGDQITTSSKAVKAICQPTDYKETCEGSLSSAGNTSNPKDLIKLAFNVTVQNIREAMKNSSLLKELAKDPRTEDAFGLCHELLEDSIDDLKRSFDKLRGFELSSLDEFGADLKTWLSGAITYQQTCLDAFENTTGDLAQKMQELLRRSGELSSNALAMVTELNKIIKTIEIPGASRRLLEPEGHDAFPSWVGSTQRRLLQATPATIKPDVVVAQDGSGKYKTINEALKDIPKQSNKTFVIYIKAGIYKEYVIITKQMMNVMFIGDGPTKTKITGNKSFVGGFNTFRTGTLGVNGNQFMAKNIGVENSAGATMHQAVAIQVSSDLSVFYNCQFDGYQDTLYAHTHRQFYRDCTVSGTIDFVFGDAAAVFQNCTMVVRKPLPNQSCMVTAQGRKEPRNWSAIVLQNCTIIGAPELLASRPPVKVFLGRPWKNFSRTVVMNSHIEGIVDPEGWSPWLGTQYLDTLYYVEFNNKGPGADQAKRVAWPGLVKNVTPEQISEFTPKSFINSETWIPATGVPYQPGL